MSSVPSAVVDLRKAIQEHREMLCIAGYMDMEEGVYVSSKVDPNEYRDLWMMWRNELSQHAPPPEPPPVRTKAEAHQALDSLLRRLEELFGRWPTEKIEGCWGENSPQPPSLARPRWDRTAKTLWLGDDAAIVYTRTATTQFPILDAFEQAGWGPTITNPLTYGSVKDAIDALNSRLQTTRLRFQRLNGDTVLGWFLTPV